MSARAGKKRVLIILFLFAVCATFVPMIAQDPNHNGLYDDLEEGENIFQLAATSDYIDSLYSTTYGSVTTGPPSGMGQDSSTYSRLNEAPYYISGSNFGYTGSGSSYTSMSGNNMWGSTCTTGASGTRLYSIKAYLQRASGSPANVKAVITTTAGVILTNGISNAVQVPVEAGKSLFGFYFSTNPTISTSTSYILWVIPSTTVNWYYYTGDGTVRWRDSTNSYSSPSNPTDALLQSYQGCIYGVQYTPYYQYEQVFRWTSFPYSGYTWTLYVDYYSSMSGSDDLDWYIGTGTNPTQLVGDNKQNDFNAAVTSYVQASTVYLKIKDDYRSGDTSITYAYISRVYLYGVPINANPTNDGTPSCSNLDDSVTLYAHKREYSITTYANDADGYADIHYMEMGIWNDAESTEYYRVQYHEDDNTFSEQYDAGTMATINTGTSSATRSGNDIDATFIITIDWDFTDISNLDIKAYVIDSLGATDTDWYEVNWKVETRLDYVTAPSVSDGSGTVDRGSVDGSFTASGTLEYYGSASNVYPPDDHVDVWASCSEYGTTTGPFSDLTLSSGVFSITCYADNVMGIDTWTFKPVEDSAGSGGTSLYYTTDLTDTYISDNVQVQSYTVADARVNIDANVNIDVLLYYDYDNSAVTDGTVTINGYSATHQGSGTWRITRTSATVTGVTYNAVAASGNTHGITTTDQNGQSQLVIWDRVECVGATQDDARVNIGDSTYIYFTLHYDYDDTDVSDGTVTFTYTGGMESASYVGSGQWRALLFELTVRALTYDGVDCSGNTHGITEVFMNGYEVTQIWDRVQVQSYTPADTRINADDAYVIDVLLYYDYDNTAVTDGSVTVNGVSATHQGSGTWRITGYYYAVGDITFNVVACSGNTYGITEIDQNGQSQTIIFDRVKIVTTTVDDSRVNINGNVEIRVTAYLEYDSHYLGSGDSITLDGVAMTWDAVNSWFDLARAKSSVGAWLYFVNASTEATYGITQLNLDGKEVTVIWDRVKVISYTVADARVNINVNVDIDVLLYYEYDSAFVTDGSVTVNGYSATHQGSGVWRITRTSASVTGVTYNTVTATGNTYGITEMNQNGQSKLVIWDRVKVISYYTYDNRVTVTTSTNIRVELRYEYDNVLVSDGSVYINGTIAYAWYDEWLRNVVQSTTQRIDYTGISVSGNTHGITEINYNGFESGCYIIWDRILITYLAGDGTGYNFNFQTGDLTGWTTQAGSPYITSSAGHGYVWHADGDGTYHRSISSAYLPCVEGDVFYGEVWYNASGSGSLPYFGIYWQGAGTWSYFLYPSLATKDGQWYYFFGSVTAPAGATGAAVWLFNYVGNSDAVEYDGVRIYSPDVTTRLGMDETAEYHAKGELEYDGHPLGSGDSFTISGVSFTWNSTLGCFVGTDTSGSVQAKTYNSISVANEDTYGIWQAIMNGWSLTQVFDRIIIDIQADSETPVGGADATFTITVTFEYDSSTCYYWTITIGRNGTYYVTRTYPSNTFTDNQVKGIVYNYNATGVYDILFGIQVFTTNLETVAWGNNAPTNGSLTGDYDDTDNWYARYRYYDIVVVVTDIDGVSDLYYVNLYLYDSAHATLQWRVYWIRSSDTFAEVTGTDYIALAAWSYSSIAGSTVTLHFIVKIEWAHYQLDDCDFQVGTKDMSDIWDWDWYDENVDIVNSTSYSTAPYIGDVSGDDGRGSAGGNIWGYGVVTYYGSSLHPLGNETDIWIFDDYSGTWSGNVDASGIFNISMTANSTVQLTTYSFKVVIDGAGSGADDLYYTTAPTDTYISDTIYVYSDAAYGSTMGDYRTFPSDSSGGYSFELRYTYDDAYVTGGVVYINGTSAYYYGYGLWYGIVSQLGWTDPAAYVGVLVTGVTDSAYDISALDTASAESHLFNFIIDYVYIYAHFHGTEGTGTDWIQDCGEPVYFGYYLKYLYDGASISSGSATINGSSTSYYSGRFYITAGDVQWTSGNYTYVLTSFSGGLYNIQDIWVNATYPNNAWVVHDKIYIYPYITPSWTIVGDTVYLYHNATYEFLGTTAGITCLVNGSNWSTAHAISKSTVGNYTYIYTSIYSNAAHPYMKDWFATWTVAASVIFDDVVDPQLSWEWIFNGQSDYALMQSWLALRMGTLMYQFNSTDVVAEDSYLYADLQTSVYSESTQATYATQDWGFVGAYGNAPTLFLGVFDFQYVLSDLYEDNDFTINIRIRLGLNIGGTWHNVTILGTTGDYSFQHPEDWYDDPTDVRMEVQLNALQATYTDGGAVGFISNDLNSQNVVKVRLYNGDNSTPAPAGVRAELTFALWASSSGVLTNVENYTFFRITDEEGFVYVTVPNRWKDWDWADTWSAEYLCGQFYMAYGPPTVIVFPWDGLSTYLVLYYKTAVSQTETEIQRFQCLHWPYNMNEDFVQWTDAEVSGTVQEDGVHFNVTTYYAYFTAGDPLDMGEFNSIIGYPWGTYLWLVFANTSTRAWNYTIIADNQDIFVPDVITEPTSYRVWPVRAMWPNTIFWTILPTLPVTVYPTLAIEERMVTVGEEYVSLSARANYAANYSTYEDNVLIGTGTVAAGEFVVFWTRQSGVGGVNYGVFFNSTQTGTLWVNGTYSKATVMGALDIVSFDAGFTDLYLNVKLVSNWGNTTVYLYEGGVAYASGAEATVIVFRKLTTEGVHQLGILIDGGGDSFWKNITYSVAVDVTTLKLVAMSWDTGSWDTVTFKFQTNWANATVYIMENTYMHFYGLEGASGVDFLFYKTQTVGLHTVQVVIESGTQSLSYYLAYSWIPNEISSPPIFSVVQVGQNIGNRVSEELIGNIVLSVPMLGFTVFFSVGVLSLLLVVIRRFMKVKIF